jgi:hypothetical protein
MFWLSLQLSGVLENRCAHDLPARETAANLWHVPSDRLNGWRSDEEE